MNRFFIVGFLLLCCGCKAVYSPSPVGDTPKNICQEQDKWEGTWMTSDGSSLSVKVIDGCQGIIKVGWIEETDKKTGWEFKTAEVFIRDGGRWTFASTKSDDTNETLYVWCRIKNDGKQVTYWNPDVEKFRKLVEENRLPGSTNENGVTLGTLSSNHLALITSETNDVLFAWDEPTVLFKSSK